MADLEQISAFKKSINPMRVDQRRGSSSTHHRRIRVRSARCKGLGPAKVPGIQIERLQIEILLVWTFDAGGIDHPFENDWTGLAVAFQR